MKSGTTSKAIGRVTKLIATEQVADAVAFAIAQPADVLVENITVGNLSGSV